MRPTFESVPVHVHSDGSTLDGDLTIPAGAEALVIFAHGSGSSRFSTRNRAVAEQLQRERLGTLLLDLLTREEETLDFATAQYRFDIEFLATRVVAAVDWAVRNPPTSRLRLGLFGASTGAAAALIAARARPRTIGAIVSRGGRPDLAARALRDVTPPTLLIVGGADHQVIELNRRAYDKLSCERHLEIIPGATHLFEEPGTLEEVGRLAGAWFTHHLCGRVARSA